MSADDIDLADALSWEEGLPRPQWDLVETLVESHCEPDDRHEAWIAVGRKWLAELGDSLGGGYDTAESEHFLLLAPGADLAGLLVRAAERCHASLLTVLPGVADFAAPGKQVVLAFEDTDDYYRYVSPYYPECEHGGSGGVQIREGYPHVACWGKNGTMLEPTVAHELMHASLGQLTLPQWVEEGLAVMFQRDMGGQGALLVDAEMARRHKRYWGNNGLDEFWHGDGFTAPCKVQELSYQLAEILARLLLDDARPRWFGLVKEPQRRFFAFLRAANRADCGAAACRKHLGFGPGELAARFLGEGNWEPGL